MSKKIYKDYFNIDPKYYAAVTADLIDSGQVSWKSFYPHETFIKLLEKTHAVLSGKDPRSLWVEGAYGTGKSHAALTVKSLLEASDEEVEAYFEEFGLSRDLCGKLIADKNMGKLFSKENQEVFSFVEQCSACPTLQESVSHDDCCKGVFSLIHDYQNRGVIKKYSDPNLAAVLFAPVKFMARNRSSHIDAEAQLNELIAMMQDLLLY